TVCEWKLPVEKTARARPEWTLHGPRTPVLCLAAHRSRVLAGYEDGSLCLWDSPDAGARQVTHEKGSRILAVAFDNEGQAVVSIGSDGKIRRWRLSDFADAKRD